MCDGVLPLIFRFILFVRFFFWFASSYVNRERERERLMACGKMVQGLWEGRRGKRFVNGGDFFVDSSSLFACEWFARGTCRSSGGKRFVSMNVLRWLLAHGI